VARTFRAGSPGAVAARRPFAQMLALRRRCAGGRTRLRVRRSFGALVSFTLTVAPGQGQLIVLIPGISTG